MSEMPGAHQDLPQLHLSPEMEDVLHDLAEEKGVSVGQIKHRARVVMKYLDEQIQSEQPAE